MSNVETVAAGLPNDTSDDLFTVSGTVRIIGLSGIITVSADDPYVAQVRVGTMVAATLTIGGQAVNTVIGSNTADAGSFVAGNLIAHDGAVIQVSSSDDPGLGAVQWLAIYEALEPNARIVAA